jgi:ATP-binding cassette subfamily C protein CydCD
VQLYLAAADTTARTGAAGTGAAAAAEAQRCLEAAGAGHLSSKHPAELSPGELRRVALARGLARVQAGATLLLLDEPTAHLDRESASVVNESILLGGLGVAILSTSSGLLTDKQAGKKGVGGEVLAYVW